LLNDDGSHWQKHKWQLWTNVYIITKKKKTSLKIGRLKNILTIKILVFQLQQAMFNRSNG
jgi:hypothetical protein